MKYLQITVATISEFSDIVANKLLECGSSGVVVKDCNDIKEVLKSSKNWDYVDESLLEYDSIVYVAGFYEEDADSKNIIKEIESLKGDEYFATGSLEITTEVLSSEDWENVWKKYYEPIDCGKITIVPKWLESKNKDSIPVYIDPGMAFGTGNHETTSMCITLMQNIDIKNKCVIDMGCGSGILGICASKLGAGNVLYTDIDADAVRIAKDNAEYNKTLDDAEFICGDLATRDGVTADLLIANLTADLLVRLNSNAVKLTSKGSYAVVSGIIDDYANSVIDAYKPDFDILKIEKRNGWQAMLLKRK